jgi:hypothetical protein
MPYSSIETQFFGISKKCGEKSITLRKTHTIDLHILKNPHRG